MLQPGRHPDLALEALRAERGGKVGLEHLERDRAVVPEIVRQVHGGQPPWPSSRSRR